MVILVLLSDVKESKKKSFSVHNLLYINLFFPFICQAEYNKYIVAFSDSWVNLLLHIVCAAGLLDIHYPASEVLFPAL